MTQIIRYKSFRHAITWLLAIFIGPLAMLPAQAAPAAATAVSLPSTASGASSPQTIPLDQIGVEADQQSNGHFSQIVATVDGVELNAPLQDLAGRLTREGLWLRSTAEQTTDAPFRLLADTLGRQLRTPTVFAASGTVSAEAGVARLRRPGIVEEYSVSTDGIRQDLLLLDRPAGEGVLRLEVALAGATLQSASNGLHLQLPASGRTLAYHRLLVSDASGKQLSAEMERVGPTRLAIVVDDQNATWPLRIDPTFSDADWSSLAQSTGLDGDVYALAVNGNDLYAGGYFITADGVAANRIAKWDGSSWSSLGTGLNGAVYALAVSGSDLYVGGQFSLAGGLAANRIAKWDGSSWSSLGDGLGGDVTALAVLGSDLYVGGTFRTAGGVAAGRIVKWDGSSWSALDSGLGGDVTALAVLGNNLYAGGYFLSAGGVAANRIAKWDGSSWSSLGSGLDDTVTDLAVLGSDLYVGGTFRTAGGVAATQIAKWDGSSWSSLDTGLRDGAVYALAVLGSDLYAGGTFITVGGVAANRIAKWDGSSWSSLGSGLRGNVIALAGSGSNLYVGGAFDRAGNTAAPHIAKAHLSPTYTISVSASPVAGGSVSGDGTVNYGDPVIVTATANAGYSFVNWTEGGNAVSTAAQYSFTATGNRSLVAHFSLNQYTITASVNPAAGGSVGGGGIIVHGDPVTVTATANLGYSFVNWTEGGNAVSTAAQYGFTATGNRSLVANFSLNQYTITASAIPAAGGSVTGGGTVSYGSTRTVTATANSGYSFANWTENGNPVSINATYVFTATSNRTLVANFSPSQQAVALQAQTMCYGDNIMLNINPQLNSAQAQSFALLVISGPLPQNLVASGNAICVPYTGFRSMVELTNQLVTQGCAANTACNPVRRIVFDNDGSYRIETIQAVQVVRDLFVPLVSNNCSGNPACN